MAKAFRVKLVVDRCLHRLLKLVSGLRKGTQVAGESFGRHDCFSQRFVSSMSAWLFRASGRPSSCSLEGQYTL